MSLERTPRFTGRVEGGKVHLDSMAAYGRYLKGLEGQRITVSVAKHRNIRSLNANAYYWSCVVPLIGEHCGYDAEEAHEALKLRFLQTQQDTELPTVRSTASLNTKEFAEYVDDCIRLAAELGVMIPLPGEMG